jgi:lysozyme
MGFMIDVSHYQGSINWPQVAADGCQGAYIKVSDGTGVDSAWQTNHAGAGAAGIPRGMYHFSEDGNAASEAADFASAFSAGWELDPVLDEEKSTANAAFTKAFRTAFRNDTGHERFRVYTSYALLNGAMSPANWIDGDTTIWAARYNSTLGWNHPALVLWQNTSSATIPGILGDIDEDQYMNGWNPAADAPKGIDDMGLNSQWIIDQAKGRAFCAFEVGSNSQIVKTFYAAAKALYGNLNSVVVVFEDDNGNALAPVTQDQSGGTLASNHRWYWQAPSGASSVTIEFDPASPGLIAPYNVSA